MSQDSEDRRSDFAKWAEEMSYEEEKEYKKQKKREEKEQKKLLKAQKKAAKKTDVEAETGDAESTDTAETEVKNETAQNSLAGVSVESKPEDSGDKSAESADTSEKTETAEASEKAETAEARDTQVEEEEEEDYNPDYVKPKRRKKKGGKEEVNIVKELLGLIIYIGIVIILCYCIITFVGQRTTVHGNSMNNTLQNGDQLWIDKLSYHFSDPKRFDIIVFPYKDSDVYYIKRIIGLPGETVQITPGGTILINDEVLNESYGKEVINDCGTANEPITLGEDEYFVLGDNRNDSRDSRWPDVGNIHKSKIIGKAVLRLSPFSKFGKIK